MKWLSDAAIDHLRTVADRPDLGDTPYEVAEAIARGGMGTVYRAHDRKLDRDVALKVMNALAPTPREVERMRTEARILARLEHPGIVPVHDLGVLPDGRMFYVMKLVQGRRLDEAMANELLLSRLRTFGRICEAVAFAHARGIVHRDLKPENVMVGPFGEVLVLDWGVAKLLPEEKETVGRPPMAPAAEAAAASGTAHGTVLGTPGYMSPEQARGEVDRVDERSDVYGLGGILNFLLTGRAPGSAGVWSERREDPLARLRAAETRSNPAALAALAWAVPRPLQAVCAKAMAVDSGNRYASVSDLAADVERFLSRLPVQAYPEGPLERVGRLAAKYRTPLLLVAAYLLMRVVLALFARV